LDKFWNLINQENNKTLPPNIYIYNIKVWPIKEFYNFLLILKCMIEEKPVKVLLHDEYFQLKAYTWLRIYNYLIK